MQAFRRLDLHPKFRDEFREKTWLGGIVSICSFLLVIYLLVAQLRSFWTPDRVESMAVDSATNIPLRINFDVTFPSLSCTLLSLDVMDLSGNHQLDVDHNVFKRSLDADGNVLAEQTQKNKLGHTLTSKEQLHGDDAHRGLHPKNAHHEADHEHVDDENNPLPKEGAAEKAPDSADQATPSASPSAAAAVGCGDCYGAGEPGQCCNDCASVYNMYKMRGWSFDPATVVQCATDAILQSKEGNVEGCNIYGYVEVPRVAGNIHFAPGRSFQHANMHVHDLMAFALQTFNVTHTINSFSFGTRVDESLVNPLDKHTKVLEPGQGNGMFQYYVKVVPTDYISKNGVVYNTNQYSVTEHFRSVSIERGSGLPGVFFFYDLSSIRVTIADQPKSFGHFITSLCAIAGGMFTVFGVIDSGIHIAFRKYKNAKSIA